MADDLGINLGRVFEISFNIGILTYFQHSKFQQSYGDVYLKPLSSLYLHKIQQAITKNYIDKSHKEIIGDWVKLFIQKGWTSGYSFIREYIEATGWLSKSKIEILYFQCGFYGDNSFGILDRDELVCYKEILERQGFENVDITRYKETGEFLKADTLLLTRYFGKYRILAVDLSTFTTSAIHSVTDLNNIQTLQDSLRTELNYVRSKSSFCGLGIDTGNSSDKDNKLNEIYSKELVQYFSAFKTKDKEAVKVIQACSYAWSFYKFLQASGKISDTDPVKFNCFGYSDRMINGITLTKEKDDGQDSLEILKTCYKIYKDKSFKDINESRSKVLEVIKSNAARNFQDGRRFVTDIVEARKDTISYIHNTEVFEAGKHFFNTAGIVPESVKQSLQLTETKFRDAHAELIHRALADSRIAFLFLTGNPGIGKTTAVAEQIIEQLNEGSLLIYISPRIQVNKDIIEKFREKPDLKLFDDNLICINANKRIIDYAKGRYAVEYHSNKLHGNHSIGQVQFLDANTLKDNPFELSSDLVRYADNLIQVERRNKVGVLASLCEAIHTCIINLDLPNNIVATASIQSLKETRYGNTLKHFSRIFSSAYNSSSKPPGIIKNRMKAIASRMKNIFIMIDEITGSQEGVAFLHGILEFIEEYDLLNPEYGFNVKVITADASLTIQDVVNSHLANNQVQGDKIFVRQVADSMGQCLSIEEFEFLRQPATLINANSYPAEKLTINYEVFIQSLNSEKVADDNLKLDANVAEKIKSDILQLLKADEGQIIVYIQNKDSLKQLISNISKERPSFKLYQEYLEIHASLSDREEAEIQRYQNQEQIKVVFMTASASRGLSFPKTKHILVQIPGFQIEQNLMEIIQVIYRGRGGELDKGEKFLTFYLSDKAIYYPKKIDEDGNRLSADESEKLANLSLQEACLNVLNILIILKASIMTRILGSGQIGRERYVIIPIGGKSISQAGETFIGSLATLLREIRKEFKKQPEDSLLQDIEHTLYELLSVQKTEIIPYSQKESFSENQEVSYFSIGFHVLSQMETSLDKLLSLSPIEPTYVRGSLLIVPLSEKLVKETNYIDLEKIIDPERNEDFINKLGFLVKSGRYPKQITSAAYSLIDLARTLFSELERSQKLSQTSRSSDRYYALPIQTFISFPALEDYFENERRVSNVSFRDILAKYVYTLALAYNILPIDSNYENIPYVVFNSSAMNKLGKSLFNENQIFQSKEMNILNLILSQED
ncbi:helicase [Sphaerospermopsis aphanizomenoides BCCUSP55]|uniref:helicase-related protein n=1 Tax=Sphaerospermopsis aphanizomenoides TaxID=459663 RepID=UPI001907AC79|nr:helicase-related protein [Sphaerospermopsis aphanizomenoides]MBK1988508.1 helicase [Sphaerospermopsis aphanizomenoides BCCUSP55]